LTKLYFANNTQTALDFPQAYEPDVWLVRPAPRSHDRCQPCPLCNRRFPEFFWTTSDWIYCPRLLGCAIFLYTYSIIGVCHCLSGPMFFLGNPTRLNIPTSRRYYWLFIVSALKRKSWMADRIQTKWPSSRAILGTWVGRREIYFQNVLNLINFDKIFPFPIVVMYEILNFPK